ncbi:transient receptor potential cation channel subfamily V member 3-like [Lineus longissimus]|uniref:transient receptor potential cation channel subfamily V member 3-like n=1 Tax=Lineus longissimus TaxID=88925 RepID=UPI002B4C5B42
MSLNKIVPNERGEDSDLAINLKAIKVATGNIARKAKVACDLANKKNALGEIVDGTYAGMEYGDFEFWFDIIRTDDAKAAREVLDGCDESEMTVLMNAPFVYDDLDHGHFGLSFKERSSLILFHKPTSIAVINRSRKVLKLMTENGVLHMSRDTGGNNIFHVMATVAHTFPEHEDEISEMYTDLVRQIDSLTIIKHLLSQENKDGFRPLELAAHYDVYALMIEIFETEGVYKFSTYGLTPVPLVRYDVTEYESWNGGRRRKSPLRSLVYLTQPNMRKASCDRLFRYPLIEMWVNKKFRNYLWMIIIWFLLRTIFLGSFLDSGFEKHIFYKKEHILDETCPNKSSVVMKILSQGSRTSDSGFSLWYFIVYALAVLGVDVLEIFALFTFRRTPKQGNALRFWTRCSFTFYTRVSVGVACFVGLMDVFVINFGLKYISNDVAEGITIVATTAYIFAVMALVWSHLFFLQLVPKIGHFLIGFQWMLLAFISFLVVFLYIFGSLSIAFNKLYYLSCIDQGFADFGTSLYSTFLVMLNMKNFLVFEPDVAILHAVFVFIIALLLLNFLIAILTDTQATVTKHIATIESVQVLDMVLTLEDRFGWFYNLVWKREAQFVFTLKETIIRGDGGSFVNPCIAICASLRSKIMRTNDESRPTIVRKQENTGETEVC